MEMEIKLMKYDSGPVKWTSSVRLFAPGFYKLYLGHGDTADLATLSALNKAAKDGVLAEEKVFEFAAASDVQWPLL